MGWVSPTGFEDLDGLWTNEPLVYDEDTETPALNTIQVVGWGSYIGLTLTAISCNKIRYYVHAATAPEIDKISVDVWYGNAWHNIYQGAFTKDTWKEKEIGSTQTVSKAQVKFHSTATYKNVYLAEFDFWEVPGVTHELAGVIAGVATVSGIALITRGLAGLASGVASVSGSIVGIWTLKGIAAGVASVSGATSILRQLAGLSSGICSTVADLTNIKWLLGSTSGACLATGSLTVSIARWLAGVSSGVCSAVGRVVAIRGLAGVVSGVCSVTGILLRVKWLAGLSQGVATVTGALFHVRAAIRVLDAVRNLLAVRNIPPVR